MLYNGHQGRGRDSVTAREAGGGCAFADAPRSSYSATRAAHSTRSHRRPVCVASSPTRRGRAPPARVRALDTAKRPPCAWPLGREFVAGHALARSKRLPVQKRSTRARTTDSPGSLRAVTRPGLGHSALLGGQRARAPLFFWCTRRAQPTSYRRRSVGTRFRNRTSPRRGEERGSGGQVCLGCGSRAPPSRARARSLSGRPGAPRTRSILPLRPLVPTTVRPAPRHTLSAGSG